MATLVTASGPMAADDPGTILPHEHVFVDGGTVRHLTCDNPFRALAR